MSNYAIASQTSQMDEQNSFANFYGKTKLNKEPWVNMPSGSQYELGQATLSGAGTASGPKFFPYRIGNPKHSMVWVILLVILILVCLGLWYYYKARHNIGLPAPSFYYF